MGLAFPRGKDYYIQNKQKPTEITPVENLPTEVIIETKKPSTKGFLSGLTKGITNIVGSGLTLPNTIYSKAKNLLSAPTSSVIDPLLATRLVQKGRAEDLNKLAQNGVQFIGADPRIIKNELTKIDPQKYQHFSDSIVKDLTTREIKREDYQKWLQGQGQQQTNQPLVPFTAPKGEQEKTAESIMGLKYLTGPTYREFGIEGQLAPGYIPRELTEEEINARIPEFKDKLLAMAKEQKIESVRGYVQDFVNNNPLVNIDKDRIQQMETNLMALVDVDKLTYDDLYDIYINDPIKVAIESGRAIENISPDGKVTYERPGALMAMSNAAIGEFTSGIIGSDLAPRTPEERIGATFGNIIGMVGSLYLTGQALKGAMMMTKTGQLLTTEAPFLSEIAKSIGAFNIHGQLRPELKDDWNARLKTGLMDTTMALTFAASGAVFPGRISGMFPQIGLFAGLSYLNGDPPEIIAANALSAALLHGTGFIKVDDANTMLNSGARKSFEKITNTTLENGYANEDLDLAYRKGIFNINTDKKLNVDPQKLNQTVQSLDRSYEKLVLFGSGKPENRIFKSDKNPINNYKRTVRQIKEEVGNILNTIAPNREVKIRFSPTAINEILIPTEAGKPKFTNQNELVFGDLKTGRLTDTEIEFLKSDRGRAAYDKRVNDLTNLYKQTSGNDRKQISSRLEDLRGFGKMLGYEGRRVTDVIPPTKDKMFKQGSLDRATEELVNIAGTLRFTERGSEASLPLIRKSIAELSETTGINERDIAREVLRRTAEKTSGTIQYRAYVSEQAIDNLLAVELGEGGLLRTEETLIAQPLSVLPEVLTEKIRTIKSPEERSKFIGDAIEREFPWASKEQKAEYKEIIGRAIKTQEPVEVATKETIKKKPAERRIAEVEKQIKKIQKGLAPEQIKQQETVAKLVKILVKDLIPEAKEIPIIVEREKATLPIDENAQKLLMVSKNNNKERNKEFGERLWDERFIIETANKIAKLNNNTKITPNYMAEALQYRDPIGHIRDFINDIKNRETKYTLETSPDMARMKEVFGEQKYNEFLNQATKGIKEVKAEISLKGEEIKTKKIEEINARIKELDKQIKESAKQENALQVMKLVVARKDLQQELKRTESTTPVVQTVKQAEKTAKQRVNEIIDISTLPKEDQEILKRNGYKEKISNREYVRIIEQETDKALGLTDGFTGTDMQEYESKLENEALLDTLYEQRRAAELKKKKPNIGLSVEVVAELPKENPLSRIATPITKRWFRNLKEGFANFKSEVVDPLFFYKGLPTEFKNDIRTDIIGGRYKILENRDKNNVIIWGGLEESDINKSIDIIKWRNEVGRQEKGKGDPSIELDQAEDMLKKIETSASPEAIEAANRYRKVAEKYTNGLIERGILDKGDLMEDYMRHYTVDYTPDWVFNKGIPTRLRMPVRGYAKEAHGSIKEYRVDRDAITGQFLEIEYDNMIEDFVTNQAAKYNIIKNMSKNQLEDMLGIDTETGRINPLKPNRIYTIDDKRYRAFNPSDPYNRNIFPTKEGYMALGKYKKTYLVPEEIYNTFKSFSESGKGGLIRIINQAIMKWKRLAIFANYPSFNVSNLVGDTWMAFSQAPNYGKLAKEIPLATKYIMQYMYGKGKVDPALKELHNFIIDEDITRGTYIGAELPKIEKHGPISRVIKGMQNISQARESILRTAYASYLLKEVKGGNIGEIKKYFSYIDTTGLSDMKAIGKIARDVLIDYSWASKTFNKTIRAGFMPFGLWYLKGSSLMLKYAKAHWGKALIAYMLPPVIATLWNDRNKETRELESRIPDFMQDRTHFILGENPDGTVKILSLQLPQDVLIGTKGISIAINQANLAVTGQKSWEEAAVDTIKHTITREVKGVVYLTNFFIRWMQGLATQKDPFDNSPIYSMPIDQLKQNPAKLVWEQGLWALRCAMPLASAYIRSYTTGQPMDLARKRIVENWLGQGIIGINDYSEDGRLYSNGKKITWDQLTKKGEIYSKELTLLTNVENDWVDSGLSPQDYIKTDRFKERLIDIKNMWATYVPTLKDLSLEDVASSLGERLSNQIGGSTDSASAWYNTQRKRAKTEEQQKKLGDMYKQIQQMNMLEYLKTGSKTSRDVFEEWLKLELEKK